VKTAPLSEKVAVYDLSTGATLLRWPVDARVMVASGAFSYEAPAVDDAPAPPGPVVDEPEAAHTSRARRR
jgi:hypothetical protein